jgi:hypothetical protein
MAQVVGYPGGFGVGDTTNRTNTTGTPPVPLGTVGYDASGNEYRYVRFGGTAAAGTLIQPTASATPFDAVVVTSAANQHIVGVNPAAAVINDCGWVVRNGVATGVSGGTLTAGTNKTTAAAGAAGDSAAADTNDTVGVMLVATGTMYVKGL